MSALSYAIDICNEEIIKILLDNQNIDINQKLVNSYNFIFIFVIFNLFL